MCRVLNMSEFWFFINHIVDENDNINGGGCSVNPFSDIVYRKTWKTRIFRIYT